ncbi:hypothetical protein [Liquorilactobacillus satsumensis]|uniref:hypothetical protein n=1 Tax=Liquorilactobacillus satsumensis TaxID=259059 RepID=UPI0039E8F247
MKILLCIVLAILVFAGALLVSGLLTAAAEFIPQIKVLIDIAATISLISYIAYLIYQAL